MNAVAEDILMHYGVKRRSGRYPWGSGDNPFQHSADFMARVEALQGEGLSEKEVAAALHMSTTDLRMQIRVAKHERRQLDVDQAKGLRDKGYSLNEIAREMGYANDSSVRALLNENTAANKNLAKNTSERLKDELESKGFIDVGAGVSNELGVSSNTLKEAVFILETQGYKHFGVGVPQVTNPSKQTTVEIVAKSDKDITELQKMVYDDPSLVKSVSDYHSTDGGATFNKIEYPASVNSDRVKVRYAEEGGINKDGVIELRRGVADLNLGDAHYAQVRILVDGTHYLKGMAMYSDDMPDGADIVFNTNKKSSVPKMDVLKKIKDDPDNPFGAAIKAKGQSWYDGPDGKKKLSAINKLKEEGDWDEMSKNLSSQFLSKQPQSLVRKQLNLTYKDNLAEFDEIMSLTIPTVKRKMLLDFADQCEGAAVHLKSAALPRQTTKVILPLTKLSDNEVYAPTYKNGEYLALVRFPHAGTFEIPVLKVNNRNPEGKSILGNVKDAIGINPKVAEQLSGADFDGDQVVAIPTNDRVKIKSTRPLDDLVDFDPKTAYPEKPGMKYMTKADTQKQMGMISNLITDMTLQGADEKLMARAVKHSMVVIDAEKHKLNYKQSEKDQGIAELKKRYQGYVNAEGKTVSGASTLLSRRKQDVRIPERKGSGHINPETGKVEYKTSGRTYVDKKTGAVVPATTKSKLILETDDVRTLSSGTTVEDLYGGYANDMKALAARARLASLNTGKLQYNSAAKSKYANEVRSLDAALDLAIRNAPRERQAQVIANSQVKAKIEGNPGLEKDKKALRKQRQIAISNARAVVSASGKETKINISEKEWEAIKAGAISDSKLYQILKYADEKTVREHATPRTVNTLSPAKVNKAKAMYKSGYTYAEIAEALGVSVSTVSGYKLA